MVIIDKKAVGLRIKNIRLLLGLTMEDFIERIDGKPGKGRSGTVNNWETGKNAPNKQRLQRIAELGNVSVDYVLHGRSKYPPLYEGLQYQLLLKKAMDGKLTDDDRQLINSLMLNTKAEISKRKTSDDYFSYSFWLDKLNMADPQSLSKTDLRIYSLFFELMNRINEDEKQYLGQAILSLNNMATNGFDDSDSVIKSIKQLCKQVLGK